MALISEKLVMSAFSKQNVPEINVDKLSHHKNSDPDIRKTMLHISQIYQRSSIISQLDITT